MTRPDASQYRPDVDGLRSLAIVPVILNHYGLGVPGGFIGVDVFFVISGFLITSLLIRSIDENSFSIIKFYERRARRILPALFFVLTVTTMIAALVLMPLDLIHYGKSLISTTAFSSNLLLWREFGYFDRAAELKPLLHTWSLAVEEQFYIFFPIILWAIARLRRRHVSPIILVFLVGSFALSAFAGTAAPAADFYLPLTRAWELLIGALLGIGGIPLARNPRIRDVTSAVGVALIIASAFGIDRTMPFPGWIALLPCLGAALVIYASQSGGGVGNRILQWKPLVAIGLISYSLYLWHWPLLVLAKYTANRALVLNERLPVLGIATLLSVISWRYIERPFRGSGSRFDRKQILVFSIVGSLLAIGIGGAFVVGAGFPGRLPSDVVNYAAQAADDAATAATAGCFNRTATDVRADRLCTIGATEKAGPSFVVWGDSHADRISIPLGEIAQRKGRQGLNASTGACPPLVDVGWPVAGCRAFNEEVMSLIKRRHISLVILHANWASYAEGSFYRGDLSDVIFNVMSDDKGDARSTGSNGAVFARRLMDTVERLTATGVHVVVIGSIPEIEFEVPIKMAISARFGGRKDFGPTRAELARRLARVSPVLEAIEKLPNVEVIYPDKTLCHARCEVEQAGRLLYIDDNHLSRTGLSMIEPALEPAFP